MMLGSLSRARWVRLEPLLDAALPPRRGHATGKRRTLTQAAAMTTRFHRGDLPADYRPGLSVALDTETLGLNPHRDRLCVVQL